MYFATPNTGYPSFANTKSQVVLSEQFVECEMKPATP